MTCMILRGAEIKKVIMIIYCSIRGAEIKKVIMIIYCSIRGAEIKKVIMIIYCSNLLRSTWKYNVFLPFEFNPEISHSEINCNIFWCIFLLLHKMAFDINIFDFSTSHNYLFSVLLHDVISEDITSQPIFRDPMIMMQHWYQQTLPFTNEQTFSIAFKVFYHSSLRLNKHKQL